MLKIAIGKKRNKYRIYKRLMRNHESQKIMASVFKV